MRGATFAVLSLLAACAPGQARTLDVTPATLAGALAGARGGDVLRLAPGDYGVVTIRRRTFTPSLTISAAPDARLAGIIIADGGGVTIWGGRIAARGARLGMQLVRATRVRVEGMTVTGAVKGISVDASSDLAFVGNTLTGLRVDGIAMSASRRVLAERNTCRDFSPVPPVRDAAGKILVDGDHPDCIQAWSKPTAPPTADLTIVDNDVEGMMQGIFLGDKDGGGFDRIVIRGNRIRVGFWHGIRISHGRDSIVTGNAVAAIPGTELRPGRVVKANVTVDGERNTVCGNILTDYPGSPAAAKCR